MEEHQQRIRHLFAKMAEGTSTPEERAELLEYLEGDPLPEDLPMPDELAPGGLWPAMPETEADRIRAHVLSHQQPATPVRRMRWRLAAAVLLPLAGAALWLWQGQKNRGEVLEYVNDTRTVKTIRLGDGSEIHLNRAARLTLRKGAEREAWLEGEAFFTIAAHPSRPFVVHTRHQLDVTVLGTSFNVKAGEKATEVVLNTGKVKVGDGGHEVILRPGEMAVYDADAKQMMRQQADTLQRTSWKNELMPFKERPLKEVVAQLGEQFGYAVSFEDPAADTLLFTGYLSTRDLQQAVLTLEQSFSINIRIGKSQLHVNKQ